LICFKLFCCLLGWLAGWLVEHLPVCLRPCLSVMCHFLPQTFAPPTFSPSPPTPSSELVDLDEVRGTSLLVEHCEEVAPSEVVAALQDAVAAAPGAEGRQRWRRRLHHYLDWLFQRDSQLGAAFSELQVQ
jgi:hypothetical protein